MWGPREGMQGEPVSFGSCLALGRREIGDQRHKLDIQKGPSCSCSKAGNLFGPEMWNCHEI